MKTITTYNRIATVTNAQTKTQKVTHKISVPFLGTWEVSDSALQRMRKNPDADIMGKTFSRETLAAHFAKIS